MAARETAWQNSTPKTVPFANCTFPIMQLIYLPQFCITFVFHFSWVLKPSQEKMKTMLMQNFGGQISCIVGDVQVANSKTCYKSTSRVLERAQRAFYRPRRGQASDGRRTFLKVYAISYNIDPGYMTKGNVNRELKQRRRWRQRERQNSKKNWFSPWPNVELYMRRTKLSELNSWKVRRLAQLSSSE